MRKLDRSRASVLGFLILALTVVACDDAATVSAPAEAAPAADPIVGISFEVTPERLARGKYLVEGPALCFGCHGETDRDARPTRPMPGTEGSGTIFPASERLPFDVVVPNITPDVETGAGTWTDEQFARAIRQGIGHDGRTLFGVMPYALFHSMSDEDLASVVVYIRSIPPVHKELPKMVIPEQIAARLEPLPPVSGVPDPDPSDPVARGKYLVTLAHCVRCHSPQRNGVPIPGLEFSGGRTFESAGGASVASGNLTVASANLTSDPSGIPYYDEALFIKTMREGAVGGVRELDTRMPWSQLRRLTDVDLAAIFAYLQSLEPVLHRVSNQATPTYCPLCGNWHGLGELNPEPSASAN